MGQKNHKKHKEENYLIQKYDKHVQCKGIPSWILLHFGLAHLIVGNENEVLELLKLHFPECSNAEQLGGEVVLNMVVLSGPKRNKVREKFNSDPLVAYTPPNLITKLLHTHNTLVKSFGSLSTSQPLNQAFPHL